MFELPSALFSIADGSEFRFARFYNVCEAAALAATRKSAHCLRFVGAHRGGLSKRGKNTEWMLHAAWKKFSDFASKNQPPPFPVET